MPNAEGLFEPLESTYGRPARGCVQLCITCVRFPVNFLDLAFPNKNEMDSVKDGLAMRSACLVE